MPRSSLGEEIDSFLNMCLIDVVLNLFKIELFFPTKLRNEGAKFIYN